MKKLYIVFGIPFCALASYAQPTLNQSNTAPSIGENFVYSRSDWDGSTVSTGANQTWDYSGLVETTTTTYNYVDPSTCPDASQFSSATISANIASGMQYEHMDYNSTKIERHGVYAGGVPMPYQDSEEILHYPFTYGDSYTDNFASTFTNGVVWDRAGSVTVSAEGYGTLQLPNSTVNNVLLVKIYEDYGDSYNGSELYHYYITVYMFYLPGYHIPVLALTKYEQGGNITYYANYVDDAALGVAPKDELSNISVYPTLVTDVLNIYWGSTNKSDIKSVEIINVAGQVVFASNKAVQSIETSDLNPGVYFIRISDGVNRKTLKFVK